MSPDLVQMWHVFLDDTILVWEQNYTVKNSKWLWVTEVEISMNLTRVVYKIYDS